MKFVLILNVFRKFFDLFFVCLLYNNFDKSVNLFFKVVLIEIFFLRGYLRNDIIYCWEIYMKIFFYDFKLICISFWDLIIE